MGVRHTLLSPALTGRAELPTLATSAVGVGRVPRGGLIWPTRWPLPAGLALPVARAAGASIAVASVVLFAVALPARYAVLVATIDNLTPAQQLVLADLGISGLQQARLVFAVELLFAAVYFAVGFLIFSRRSGDRVAMLVSLTLVTYVGWADPPLHALATLQPAWQLPVTAIQVIAMVSSASVFLVFPSGRFVPRWSKLLLVGASCWAAAWLLFPSSVFSLADPYHLPLPAFGAMLVCYLTGIGFQVYRLGRETVATRRRQTLLVVVGQVVAVLAYVVFGFDRFALPVVVGPSYAGIVYDLVGVPIFLSFAMLIPLTLAVSILRYHLMEIEVILNQALVYGLLTAVVAGLFPTSMAICQRLFLLFTGEKSDVVTIAMTLIFASSLTPLKNLLQRLVDRALKPAPDPLAGVRELTQRAQALVEVLDVDRVVRRALDDAIGWSGATGGAVYLVDRGTTRPAYVRGDWTQVEGITAGIEDRGRPLGWIALGPRRSGHAYQARDARVLADVGRGLAHVIRLERMIGRDVAAAVPGATKDVPEGASP